MRLNDGRAVLYGNPGGGSSWRWFPWALVGGLGVVIAVNIAMVSFALHTFPGQAGSDGFDLSNHYDRVLDNAQRQAALGWTLQAAPDAAGRPVVTLTDRAGAPLLEASITAVAERPLGPAETARLAFHDAGAGRYVADAALALPGQWDLTLTATAHGHVIAATRRVVVQ
jgi:nitrogen fixation protein FixH